MSGAIAGLIGAGLLAGASLFLFVLARRRSDPGFDHRIVMPIVGVVSVPTLLATGISLGLCAYHAASYSLLALGRDVLPTPLPQDRWWVLPIGVVVVVLISRLIDGLEKDDAPAA